MAAVLSNVKGQMLLYLSKKQIFPPPPPPLKYVYYQKVIEKIQNVVTLEHEEFGSIYATGLT